jgi:predicted phage-related endonuclease
MSGNSDRLIALWREKRGEQPGEDLSNKLAVQMGSFTEPLNRAWFEKQTGIRVLPPHPSWRDLYTDAEPFMRVTLDGIAGGETGQGPESVFEAKHVGVRSTDAEVFERYVPQLTHALLCTSMPQAYLSVIKGNGDWVMFTYELDAAYADALLNAERRFWACVQSGEPPAPLPLPPAPKPKGVKEYDLTGSNEWAAHAADYSDTILAADRHDIAKKALKALVPDDASKAHGHGVTITRTKAGALRFAAQEA